MKLNGRHSVLARIAENGADVVYADTGFITPNYWISNAIIRDFIERGIIERVGHRVSVTTKGAKVLSERKDEKK